MNNKKLTLAFAAVLATNSLVLAATIDDLKSTVQVDRAILDQMVTKADQETVQDLIMTYQQVQKLADSLRVIQNNNESDTILNYANKAQVVLVGASAIALNSHIKKAEKAKYMLQLAAATALLNSFIRHYAEIKNLKPSEIGVFLNRFTHEMTQDKALTPEMIEMADSLNKISNQLISQKTQIDSVVTALGGGSDAATGALIILSIAHWVSPKLAKDGEAVLKTISQKVAAGGTAVAQNSKVVGGSGAVAGVPDIIGITLGLDSTRSQEMISATLNNLDTASRKLQAQIASKK